MTVDLTLQEILDRARDAGEWPEPGEAGLLFAAAVRLAAEQGAALRPRTLHVDSFGTVSLLRDELDELPDEYLAPELLGSEPPRRTEPRCLVYAAGALGYELFARRPAPRPPAVPGPELTGPLGDLLRVALAADRRERFGDLQQLLDAVEVVQPRRRLEEERQIFAALVERARRWGRSEAAVEELRAKLAALEASLFAQGERLDANLAAHAALIESGLSAHRETIEAGLAAQGQRHDAALARLGEAVHKASAARAAAEQRARDEAEERAALAALHPPRSPFVKALLPALLGGVVGAGAATAMLLSINPALVSQRSEKAAQPGTPGAQAADAAAQPPVGAQPPATAPGSAAAGQGSAPEQPAGPGQPTAPGPPAGAAEAAAVTGSAAGSADAGKLEGVPAAREPASQLAGLRLPEELGDAGASLEAPAARAAPDAGLARGTSKERISPAMIAHAVARSQVSRGDKALEQGRSEEAIASFQAALQNEPDLPEAVRGLAMSYVMQGKEAAGVKEYQRYLRLAPAALDAEDIRRVITELKGRSKIGDGEEK